MGAHGTDHGCKINLPLGYVTNPRSHGDQTHDSTHAPRVLVACHCSMVVVNELRTLGIDAWSCDLKPAEQETQFHIIGDARDIVKQQWDALIASPVCRVMANSGSKHLYLGMKKENGPCPKRWADLDRAVADFMVYRDAMHIPIRMIENSIMHQHARERVGRQTQVCQPWWFGDPFFKAMALWIIGAAPIVEDPAVSLRAMVPKPGTPEHKAWSACWMAAPGPEREADRSRTTPGTARAWAAHIAAALRQRDLQLPLFEAAA